VDNRTILYEKMYAVGAGCLTCLLLSVCEMDMHDDGLLSQLSRQSVNT